jgi:hypothetical protein
MDTLNGDLMDTLCPWTSSRLLHKRVGGGTLVTVSLGHGAVLRQHAQLVHQG